MFGTIERPGNSSLWLSFIGLYFLQLFLCYPLSALAAQPFIAILPALGLTGDYPSNIHFAGYHALVYVLGGIIVGWSEGLLFRRAVPSGRWIWVPAIFVIADFVRSLFSTQPVPYLNEYLFETAGEGALAVVLFTYPSCCAVGYSLGMFLAGKSNVRFPIRPLSFAGLVWLCVFVGAIPILGEYEHASIDKWSRMRYVIQPGLRISSDPNLLCASENAGRVLLTTFTLVQSLETRNCGGDHLLGSGDPPQPRSWTLEHVKVLNGPNVGAEGWVQSYGLLETVRTKLPKAHTATAPADR
jgi:hypothetical protein